MSNRIETFHVIEEGVAIVYSKGVYRQAKVYRRGNEVYAGWASGFVRLTAANGTSHPNVTWREVQADGVSITGGRLGAPEWRP